jgi:hypothetical protein
MSGVPLTGCGTPLWMAGVFGANAAPRARPMAYPRCDPPMTEQIATTIAYPQKRGNSFSRRATLRFTVPSR